MPLTSFLNPPSSTSQRKRVVSLGCALLLSTVCLSAVLVLPAQAQSPADSPPRPAVPDRPAPIIELPLVANDKLRPTLAWISDRDLLATTRIAEDSKFWETRVVQVDARTGEISDVIAEGSVLCANPQAGMAGLLLGSKAGLFTGDSGTSQPTPTVYAWQRNARSLQAATPGGELNDYNAWICRSTRPEHRALPMPLRNAEVVYLESRHGLLTLTPTPTPDAPDRRSVNLVQGGRSKSVDLKQQELLTTPEFLPFRNAYLIASGSMLAEAFYRDEQGEAQQESPIITMAPDGKVKRENFRGPLSRMGLVTDALLRPYAQGVLVVSHAWRRNGGGIYTFNTQSNSLRRVWCVGQGDAHNRQCKVDELALSPDGCKLAFYARGSDDPTSRIAASLALKVIDLCKP